VFEKYNDVSPTRAAELLCCDLATPSVELQAASAARCRLAGKKPLAGYASAEAAILAQRRRAAEVVAAWCLAHPGEQPDLEALLSE